MFVSVNDLLEEVTEEDALRNQLQGLYGEAFDEYDFQEALARKDSGLSKDVVSDYPFVVSVNSL